MIHSANKGLSSPIHNWYLVTIQTRWWQFVLQTCSPPGLVLSLSPGLGSISDGVPSPGAAFYRPASRTSPHYRPASRTSPPCNDLLMAMTNSQGKIEFSSISCKTNPRTCLFYLTNHQLRAINVLNFAIEKRIILKFPKSHIYSFS